MLSPPQNMKPYWGHEGKHYARVLSFARTVVIILMIILFTIILYNCICICMCVYICSPPPPKIYLFSSKSLGITRNPETPLFTTLLAMVFNIAFLLQRCLKLLENHGACRPIVCQPPYARRPFILFVSACASAAPARHGTRFVSKPYTARGFPTPRRDWPSTCIRSSPTSLTIEGHPLL